MSLLDYAPQSAAPKEVTLRLRLSVYRSWTLIAIAVVFVSTFGPIYVTVVDPEWHPRRIQGKGAWLVLLLLALPIFWRALVLWSLGGLAALGLTTRAVRLGDRQIDYIIGPDGITNVGLFYSRMVAWKYIEHIEIQKQGATTFAHAKRLPGTRVEIVEKVRGISQLHLFNKGSIVIPLELVGLSTDEFATIIHRFRPALAIRDESGPTE